jgi:shikimate kinase
MKGITFIGMAGAGKSAVGRITAENLGWRFVDLDKYILETQKISHHEFMEQNGEQALKNLEEGLAFGLDLSNTVFSPPGSMIYSERVMNKIKQESIVVYLRVRPETVAKRLGERLYKNGIVGLREKGLAGVMAERIPLYEKYAEYTFDSADQSKQEMAKKVIDGLIAAGVKLIY